MRETGKSDEEAPPRLACAKCHRITGELLPRVSGVSPVNYYRCSHCYVVWSEEKTEPERTKQMRLPLTLAR